MANTFKSMMRADKESQSRMKTPPVLKHKFAGNANTPLRFNHSADIAEEFQRLKTNIFDSRNGDKKQSKAVLFTSSVPGEGTTSIVMNFAMALALAGERVVLVDANLKAPSLHHAFTLDAAPGFAELIMDKAPLNTIIKKTGFENLSVVTCGGLHHNPYAVLKSSHLESPIAQIKEMADVVLFDSPPVNSFSNTAALGEAADAIVLVIYAEKTRWEVVQHAKMRMENVQDKIIGTVLNRRKLYIPNWIYNRI